MSEEKITSQKLANMVMEYLSPEPFPASLIERMNALATKARESRARWWASLTPRERMRYRVQAAWDRVTEYGWNLWHSIRGVGLALIGRDFTGDEW